MHQLFLVLVVLLVPTAAWLAWQLHMLRSKYGPAFDVDAHVQAVRRQILREEERQRVQAAAASAQSAAQAAAAAAQLLALRQEYGTAKTTYDRLVAEIALTQEELDCVDVGLYSPHFDYDSLETYKQALTDVRGQQRSLIKQERAVSCGVAWMVGNSRKEGERMQKQYSKLLLRAFNGECDAAVATVRWDNVTKMEERIRKAFAAISALGGVMQISLCTEYLDLKLRELRLEHEFEQRKYREAEEQRRIREQMREEEKAAKELERAQRDAAAEEERQERALEKARRELTRAKGAELVELQRRLVSLELALAEARAVKERARSMAEQTRCGYVYIISNHGSFGEGVIKIGMTRRLDPMDRVKELGDASVPFAFDVHGMVYSEDAPALETMLHRQFSHARVNQVNMKKEFFRVALADLSSFAAAKGLKLELTLAAEAREYRESLAKLAAAPSSVSARAANTNDRFPVAV